MPVCWAVQVSGGLYACASLWRRWTRILRLGHISQNSWGISQGQYTTNILSGAKQLTGNSSCGQVPNCSLFGCRPLPVDRRYGLPAACRFQSTAGPGPSPPLPQSRGSPLRRRQRRTHWPVPCPWRPRWRGRTCWTRRSGADTAAILAGASWSTQRHAEPDCVVG